MTDFTTELLITFPIFEVLETRAKAQSRGPFSLLFM